MALRHRQEFRDFVRLFNEGRYHESYEVLMEVWRANPSNTFVKGLIQLAGAFDHWKEQSYYWAESLFRSAADLLRRYGPRHEGLDVQGLVSAAEMCADVAAQQRKDRSATYRLPEVLLDITDR